MNNFGVIPPHPQKNNFSITGVVLLSAVCLQTIACYNYFLIHRRIKVTGTQIQNFLRGCSFFLWSRNRNSFGLVCVLPQLVFEGTENIFTGTGNQDIFFGVVSNLAETNNLVLVPFLCYTLFSSYTKHPHPDSNPGHNSVLQPLFP
jgi:hypothetical protein